MKNKNEQKHMHTNLYLNKKQLFFSFYVTFEGQNGVLGF